MTNGGYVTVTRDGSTRYVHRLIMEEHLGRPLTDDEDVHHIDRDRKNNAIENLVVMSRSDHHRLHWTINNPRKRQ